MVEPVTFPLLEQQASFTPTSYESIYSMRDQLTKDIERLNHRYSELMEELKYISTMRERFEEALAGIQKSLKGINGDVSSGAGSTSTADASRG